MFGGVVRRIVFEELRCQAIIHLAMAQSLHDATFHQFALGNPLSSKNAHTTPSIWASLTGNIQKIVVPQHDHWMFGRNMYLIVVVLRRYPNLWSLLYHSFGLFPDRRKKVNCLRWGGENQRSWQVDYPLGN